MESMDVRWKQRFRSFEKALVFLKAIIDKENYTPIEIGGLVRAFEFTFELGRKTLKDYLYEQGFNTIYPRETIMIGFQMKIVEDSDIWLQMLLKRHEISHIYNEFIAKKAIQVIKSEYFPALNQLYNLLNTKQ